MKEAERPPNRRPSIPDLARRLNRLRPLAYELARASAGGPGVPSATKLIRLQRACTSGDGVPALIAQTLSAYTNDPMPRAGDGSIVAGGRSSIPPPGRGQPHRSTPAPDPWRRFDLQFGGPLLAIGLRDGRTRAAYGRRLLTAYAREADRNATAGRGLAAAVAVATSLDALDGPLTLTVEAGPNADEVLITPSVVSSTHPAEIIAGLVSGGLVHGGLGMYSAERGDLAAVGHWECMRSISPDARRFLRAIVEAAQAGNPGEDHLETLAIAAGIPPASAATNLPRLVTQLAKLAELDPVALPDPPDAHAVDALPDELAVLHGLADLFAACAWV